MSFYTPPHPIAAFPCFFYVPTPSAAASGQQLFARKDAVLHYVAPTCEDDMAGSLYWHEAPPPSSPSPVPQPSDSRPFEAARVLPLAHICQMSVGKQHTHNAAAPFPPIQPPATFSQQLGFILSFPNGHWYLEAKAAGQREKFMKLLHETMLAFGRKVAGAKSETLAVNNNNNNNNGASTNVQKSPQTRSNSISQSSSNSSSSSSASSASASSSTNTQSNASQPASSSSSSSASSSSSSSSSSSPTHPLAGGHMFTHYYMTSGVIASRPLFVYYHGASPGYICWSEQTGNRVPIAQQQIAMSSIVQLSAGKSTPLFQHPSLSSLVPDRLISLAWHGGSMELEAPNAEVRDTWLHALHDTMVKLGKKAAQAEPAKPPSNAPLSLTAPVPAHLMPALEALRAGQQFTVLYSKTGDQSNYETAKITVFLVLAQSIAYQGEILGSSVQNASLYWSSGTNKVVHASQQIALKNVEKMVGGKESVEFKSEFASKFPYVHCLTIHAKPTTLNLIANSREERDTFMQHLHSVNVAYRSKKIKSDSSSSATHHASSSISTSSSPSTSTNNSTNNSTSLSLSSSNTPSPDPLQMLLNGTCFNLYYFGFKNEVNVANILLFLALPTSTSPANLCWCAPPTPLISSSQCLPFTANIQIFAKKEGPVFKEGKGKLVNEELALTIVSDSFTLSLEASNGETRNRWVELLNVALDRYGARSTKLVRSSSSSESSGNQRGRSSPSPPSISANSQSRSQSQSHSLATPSQASAATAANANAAAVAASPAAPSSQSSQQSVVNILSAGQQFTMYFIGESGEDTSEQVIVWLVPCANGPDAPGSIYWRLLNAPHEANEKNRFYLNQIRQMRSGKETAIFQSALCRDIPPTQCLSLFSSATVLNFEAPSSEIRELWIRGLHLVLTRYGLKAVDEKVAAEKAREIAAANAKANQAAAAAANEQGMALPGQGRNINNENNRTINFSDPTDFFLLQTKIGEGSYGAVYKAIDKRNGRAVAIKILPFPQGKDSQKLRREIHILQQCKSDHIVGYIGAYQKAGNLWIVMEYCAAGSLNDMMTICNRTFSEPQVACIMRQALKGLTYLHKGLSGTLDGKTVSSIIHRDIKSGNILVDSQGTCKLADFGVSSNLNQTLGRNRTVIGTPHWMAPEVLASDDYNEKADIWSLGITAYELVIGEPPLSHLHSMRAAIKIPTAPPPTLPEPQRWSEDFKSFIADCLVKDPEQRPSAHRLLSHPFIMKSPSESVLATNVKLAIQDLESRHELLDENTALTIASGTLGAASGTNRNTKKSSLRGVSSTSKSESGSDYECDDMGSRELNSDTMIVGGNLGGTMIANNISDTMVLAPSAASSSSSSSAAAAAPAAADDRTVELPPSFHDNATQQFATMVPGQQQFATMVAPASSPPAAAAAPAAAAVVASPAPAPVANNTPKASAQSSPSATISSPNFRSLDDEYNISTTLSSPESCHDDDRALPLPRYHGASASIDFGSTQQFQNTMSQLEDELAEFYTQEDADADLGAIPIIDS